MSIGKMPKYVNNDQRSVHALANAHFIRLLGLCAKTDSQLRQDLFVLSETGFKRRGYFVEFGATNGVDLSNTLLLEREFNWTGILSEPARVWHEELAKNRTCYINHNCIYKESGREMVFAEAREAELSTMESFMASDNHHLRRNDSIKYGVNSLTLVDLLKKYDAPQSIDYLSIDTEGSEYEILAAFDYDLYDIKIITCEHNYTPNRKLIFELLTSKGYVRKFEEVSQWDDWYVRAA